MECSHGNDCACPSQRYSTKVTLKRCGVSRHLACPLHFSPSAETGAGGGGAASLPMRSSFPPFGRPSSGMTILNGLAVIWGRYRVAEMGSLLLHDPLLRRTVLHNRDRYREGTV